LFSATRGARTLGYWPRSSIQKRRGRSSTYRAPGAQLGGTKSDTLHTWLSETALDRNWNEEVEYRRLSWLTDFANQDQPPMKLEAMATTKLHINQSLNRKLTSAQLYADDGLRQACERCQVPSLFVHGSDDPRSEFGVVQLAKAMPHAEFVMIDGAGHFPWIERPLETHAAVQAFMNRI